MYKTLAVALVAFVGIINSGCGAEAASQPVERATIFTTDSLQYSMAEQLCEEKNWGGSVCPSLLTLTQDLDAGRYARYPSTEDAASNEVSRMVLRVIAMDSLETVTRLQEVLSLEK